MSTPLIIAGLREVAKQRPLLVWEQGLLDMNKELIETRAQNTAMREALDWIALQPCRKEAEGFDEYMDCNQTGACITEYCLPCYARQALSAQTKGDKK